MLVKRLLLEYHFVAVHVEHARGQNVVPYSQFVKGVTRLPLNPILELREHFWNYFVLSLHRNLLAGQQEFLHFVYFLYLVDKHVLCNLRKLGHVLPLRNKVVCFFVDEKASSIKVFGSDVPESLLKVELLLKVSL